MGQKSTSFRSIWKLANGEPPSFDELLEDCKDGVVHVEKLQMLSELISVGWKIVKILHRCVLIEVKKIVNPDGTVMKVGRIRAEKTSLLGKGIIEVIVLNKYNPNDHRSSHEVNMSENTTIRMQDLKEIFETPPLQYDLLIYNCWHYADHVYRLLLQKLIREERDPGRRETLERELGTVPIHEPFTWDSILRGR